MTGYALSPALARLRAEVNALWPHRDRTSDGWIGDASHQARPSDHNPDWSAGGIVRALDIDEDLVAGLTAAGEALPLVEQIIRDPRTAYVIYEGRIWQNPAALRQGGWRPYTGVNAHRQHVHVSVRRGATWDRDGRAWGLTRALSNAGGATGSVPDFDLPGPVRPIEEDDMTPDQARKLDEVYRFIAVLAGTQQPGHDGELRLVQRIAALDALERVLPNSEETRRMLGVLLLWQTPQGPEVEAIKHLFGVTDVDLEVDAEKLAATIVASVGRDLAAQVAQQLAVTVRPG